MGKLNFVQYEQRKYTWHIKGYTSIYAHAYMIVEKVNVDSLIWKIEEWEVGQWFPLAKALIWKRTTASAVHPARKQFLDNVFPTGGAWFTSFGQDQSYCEMIVGFQSSLSPANEGPIKISFRHDGGHWGCVNIWVDGRAARRGVAGKSRTWSGKWSCAHIS